MSRPFLGCVLSLITPSGDQSLTSAHCKARSRIGNLHYLRTELAIERGVPNGVQSIRPLIIICKVPCSTDGGDAGSAWARARRHPGPDAWVGPTNRPTVRCEFRPRCHCANTALQRRKITDRNRTLHRFGRSVYGCWPTMHREKRTLICGRRRRCPAVSGPTSA